jgi:hypothetical protein
MSQSRVSCLRLAEHKAPEARQMLAHDVSRGSQTKTMPSPGLGSPASAVSCARWGREGRHIAEQQNAEIHHTKHRPRWRCGIFCTSAKCRPSGARIFFCSSTPGSRPGLTSAAPPALRIARVNGLQQDRRSKANIRSFASGLRRRLRMTNEFRSTH